MRTVVKISFTQKSEKYPIDKYSPNAVLLLVTGKELIKILKRDGWELDRITGSHHILKKKDKTLSVPVHSNRDIPNGTMNAILKQAGLK